MDDFRRVEFRRKSRTFDKSDMEPKKWSPVISGECLLNRWQCVGGVKAVSRRGTKTQVLRFGCRQCGL